MKYKIGLTKVPPHGIETEEMPPLTWPFILLVVFDVALLGFFFYAALHGWITVRA